MTIDIERIRSQQNDTRMISSELNSIKKRIISHKRDLDAVWLSDEKKGIDMTLDDVAEQLGRISSELDELGYDIMAAALEIQAEEEAAIAAEAEETAYLAKKNEF